MFISYYLALELTWLHASLSLERYLRHWMVGPCQGLAEPWFARRERETVKAKVQRFNDSLVQMRA